MVSNEKRNAKFSATEVVVAFDEIQHGTFVEFELVVAEDDLDSATSSTTFYVTWAGGEHYDRLSGHATWYFTEAWFGIRT